MRDNYVIDKLFDDNLHIVIIHTISITPTDIVSKSNVKADVNREDKISSFITYKRTYMYVMM